MEVKALSPERLIKEGQDHTVTHPAIEVTESRPVKVVKLSEPSILKNSSSIFNPPRAEMEVRDVL